MTDLSEIFQHVYFQLGLGIGLIATGAVTLVQYVNRRRLFSSRKHITALARSLQQRNVTAFIAHPVNPDLPGVTQDLSQSDQDTLLNDRVLVFDHRGQLLNEVIPLTHTNRRPRV